MENRARIFSSLILCVAYIITLYVNEVIGARLYLAGNLLALPYMLKHKCWDIVALLSFFIVVGLPKALGLQCDTLTTGTLNEHQTLDGVFLKSQATNPMQAQAQQTIADAVLRHTQALCEALRQNFIDYSIQHHERNIELYEENPAITFYSGSGEYHQSKIDKLKSGECNYSFVIESGRKYHKIIMVIDNGLSYHSSRSVHAFVDKQTGQIYKSASWKAPAKGIRYDLRLIEQREWLLENADWSGHYLYAR